MDKGYVLVLIANNDLMGKALFMAEYNVQFFC